MSQFSDQTDFPTDANPNTGSRREPAKSVMRTDTKKKLGISAAALLLGGSAWAIIRGGEEEPGGIKPTKETGQSSGGILPPDIDVAEKVTDSMTFEQAFKAARSEVGMGGVFSWHGRWYNTFEKEEWSSLSVAQRKEYTEMITGEKLSVIPDTPPEASDTQSDVIKEPIVIEGHINGQRIMGLDFDHDGVIDTLVLEGIDGYTYRVVDTGGDDGLDTLLRYDPLNDELMAVEKIDKPFVLSNDQFSDGLEASMSAEVLDSILELDMAVEAPVASVDANLVDELDDNSDHLMVNTYASDDDTYVNNGDVHDMDE